MTGVRGMTMTTSNLQPTKLAAWQALEVHYPKVREWHLRKLFADDPKRGECMATEAIGIYFDYSTFPTGCAARRRNHAK